MSCPFAKVPPQVDPPRIEERVLALWQELDAFQESNRRRARQGAPEFVFYDGPPFATGTPHYGHLLAGTIKDIVPRYWCMRGCYVERRFGWDCHGLPIENLAQQALGVQGAPEIRRLGVARFNEQCRSMVLAYVQEWRKTVTRMGRWVDFDRDYKTMDPDFMESVWWVFKRLWEQGRIYRAHRVMPYSPALTTPLSNFEAGNNYQDTQDPAITVAFRALPGHPALPAGAALLAWTTTPWTLPANLALCVHPELRYALVERADGERWLLAVDRLAAYGLPDERSRLAAELRGSELVGLRYQPLFPYLADRAQAFRVVADPFVTTGEGTGIVHIAPAYGEDDYRVARAHGIAGGDLGDLLDEQCRFLPAVAEYAGRFCKDCDRDIIRRLKEQGSLLRHETIVHSYPFCERSGAPLIYRAIDAWYVRVEDLRERLVANNQQIRWVPEAIGSHRFGNWLKEAKDWNISRNRFWGSCIPVWINVEDPSDMICIGSRAELAALSGVQVADLHKHVLDEIEIVRDGKRYRRTPEVLDCWFESGAMPYGQQHYPFADKERFERNFPAHFIAEGLDQTRGWFYTLLVLSTALFDRPAFRNVVVNGLILAEDGAKMSKSKKNYPDPNMVLDTYGADALRAYLIDSPVVRAEPLRFSERGLKEVVRTVTLPLWNALSFFTTYAVADGYDPRCWPAPPPAARPLMDRWLLSVLHSLIRDVNREMEAYRLYAVVPRLTRFIDALTNGYIRWNRPRFWGGEDRADRAAAFATLHETLTTLARVLAPFMPFLTEELHQRLQRPVDPTAPASVHWCDYPQADPALIDAELEADVELAFAIVSLGRRLREEQRLKVRQPLPALTVVARDPAAQRAVERLRPQIAAELNVKRLEICADEAAFCTLAVKPNFAALRARAGAKLKEIGAALAQWSFAEVERLERGERIAVAGVELGIADVLLQRQPLPGRAVASEGAVTVVLDTALTPELLAEGLAREVISVLQQARKDAELEVSDRIRVQWDSPDPELAAALAAHAGWIAREVLASELRRGEGEHSVEINGKPFRYRLQRR
ncbi:MAG: isoleucine--tRNA ligase [Planctomycetota bacterium]|nr:isoleucine--tRNA ligase [Planctomycetota bacterium]